MEPQSNRSKIKTAVSAVTDGFLYVPRSVNNSLEAWIGRRNTKTLRGMALFSVLSGVVATPVAAQTANAAGSMMCQSGLGDLIALGAGFLAVVLIIIGIFRGATAWMNMGSANQKKKQEGRDQLKGSVMTIGGAFMFPIFAQVLDTAGINTMSCVDWANVI